MSDVMSVIRQAGYRPHQPLPFDRWADGHLLAWHRLIGEAADSLDQLSADAKRDYVARGPLESWPDVAGSIARLVQWSDTLGSLVIQAEAIGDPFRGPSAVGLDATSRHMLATRKLLGWFDALRVWVGPGRVPPWEEFHPVPKPSGFEHVTAIGWAEAGFQRNGVSRDDLWRRCGSAAVHGRWAMIDNRLRKPARVEVARVFACAAADAVDVVLWMTAWSGFAVACADHEWPTLENELADARERLQTGAGKVPLLTRTVAPLSPRAIKVLQWLARQPSAAYAATAIAEGVELDRKTVGKARDELAKAGLVHVGGGISITDAGRSHLKRQASQEPAG